MRVVKPYVKYVRNEDNIEHIVKAAKICYASQMNTVDALTFIENLWKNKGHRSPFRHGTVYLEIPASFERLTNLFVNNAFCTCVFIPLEYSWFISTNFQVIRELDNKIFKTISNFSVSEEYVLSQAKKYPELKNIIRVSFEIQTQVSTSRELNRVSPNNICEQSTRYCNFSKEKFGGHIAFCEPHWLDATTYYNTALNKEIAADERIFYKNYTDENKYEIFAEVGSADLQLLKLYPLATIGIPQDDGSSLCYSTTIAKMWIENCLEDEEKYFKAIKDGMKPQDARGYLNLDVATKLFYTYSVKEWKHILDLRYKGTTGKPHPNAKIVAEKIYHHLKYLDLLDNYE